MKKQDKIEKIFQDNFKEFEVQPDASVWSGIHSSISSSASGLSSGLSNFSVAGKVVIGIAVASGIGLSAYFMGQNREDAAEKPNEVKVENTVVIENDTKGSPSFSDSSALFSKSSENILLEEEDKETVENTAVSKVTEQLDAEKQTEGKEVAVKPADTLLLLTSKVGSNEKKDHGISQESLIADEKNTGKQSVTTSQPSETAFSNIQNENLDQNNSSSNTEIAESSANQKIPDAISSNPMENEEVEEGIDQVIPNIFTPNKDGVNDVFRIESKNATDMKASIFNMQGEVIFRWNGLYGFWDGNLPNGQPAKEGQYFYKIILIKGDLRSPKAGIFRLER